MGKQRHQSRIKTAKITNTNKSKLLAVPHVKNWYDDIERGSKNTANAWIQRLSRFLSRFQMTPLQLAQLDKDTATILIYDYIKDAETRMAPGTIKGIVTTVKSYLRFSEVEVTRKFKIRRASSTPTLRGRKLPNGEELAELYTRANLRQSAIISFIAKAGLRPEVMGWVDASDGLTIEDLPDLTTTNGLATFAKCPPRVMVRETLSKTGKPYFTFLTAEGSRKVIAYLNDRILHGESLAPTSPVIAPSRLMRYKGKLQTPFVSTPIISRDVREALRPRFTIDPYSLRRYFEQRLSIAEADRKITHEWRQFIAGHKGDMEAVYAFGCELPPNVVEKMRETFVECEPYLDLEVSRQDSEQKNKMEAHKAIESIPPEQLGKLLEFVSELTGGKNNELSGLKKQRTLSIAAGSLLEPYHTEKSSSKNRVRTLSKSGPKGIRTLGRPVMSRSL